MHADIWWPHVHHRMDHGSRYCHRVHARVVRHGGWVVVTHRHHYVLTWHAVTHVVRAWAAHVASMWSLHAASRAAAEVVTCVRVPAAAAAAAALAGMRLPAVRALLIAAAAAAGVLLLLLGASAAAVAVLRLAWGQVRVVELAGVAECTPAIAHVKGAVRLLRPERQAPAAAAAAAATAQR